MGDRPAVGSEEGLSAFTLTQARDASRAFLLVIHFRYNRAMISDSSPIAAIATAPGRGGIGVVRISGKHLMPVAQAVCRLDGRELKPRHASYLDFVQADGSTIDRGLAIFFNAPNSYTGEEVLELQGHGGPVVMQMLLNRCLEAGRDIGLRLANPGEFTYRAFQNDKLDLAQAEAMLHFSPEPRVIERAIDSALVLRRDDQARPEMMRYEAAFPEDHARWLARLQPASAAR